MRPVRAISFDFNGTLSDDEPLLCDIFRMLFAQRGRPLSAEDYYDRLAGLSDDAIIAAWLGEDYEDIAGAVSERVARYRALVVDGSTIAAATRAAVRYAAARVPLVIVSGAALGEIEPVLEAAGLRESFRAIVSSDAVTLGKPHPESYRRALELLSLEARDVVAFEDTESGIESATGAGMRCIAVRGTLRAERLAGAERLVDAIDVELIRSLLDEA